MDTPRVIRRSITLSPKSAERLERLRERTDAHTDTEVMRDALRLYELLLEDAQKGQELCVKDRQGQVMPLRLLQMV